MFFPRQKKVALASYFFYFSRTQFVTSGVGPSSKVRYIFFSLLGMSQQYLEKTFLMKAFVFTQ